MPETRSVLPRLVQPAKHSRTWDEVPRDSVIAYHKDMLQSIQVEDPIRTQIDLMLQEINPNYLTERLVITVEPPVENDSLLAGHVVIRARVTPKKENA